ncbi:MAG: site-specific integrase [Magnetococcales bacterium]|nr:site-specific integrase [Magnetococcales bacterium]
MSIRRRKGAYFIDVTTPDGRRIRKSTGTRNKQEAQELHDRIKADLWRQSKMGDKPAYYWDDAVVRYLQEKAHKRSIEKDKEHLRWVDPFLRGVQLDAINRDMLDRMGQKKAERTSNTTANRVLEVVRCILNLAANEWEWIDKAPKVRMFPTGEKRIRWITPNEAKRLVSELPPHLAAMVEFSLATGLRQRNVTHLEWSQVDMAHGLAWIHADQSKTAKPLRVTLNATAARVIRGQIGGHDRYVFHSGGVAPIKYPAQGAWKRALKRAGIEDFRWHDLRHTWASWLRQQGVPTYALQELGGWKSDAMVKRYAHLGPGDLAEHASVIDSIYGTTTAHGQKKGATRAA